MQNILRNNLWMIIITWCLLLNGYSLMALITGTLSSIYLMAFNLNISVKENLLIGVINFSLFYILGSLTIAYKFNYFNLFAMVISINVSLLFSRLKREKLYTVYRVFFYSFITLIIFLFAAVIISNNFITTSIKANIYSLIVLIFIPYTSEMLIVLLIKEYNKKRLLDKIKVNN